MTDVEHAVSLLMYRIVLRFVANIRQPSVAFVGDRIKLVATLTISWSLVYKHEY